MKRRLLDPRVDDTASALAEALPLLRRPPAPAAVRFKIQNVSGQVA